MSGPTGWPAGVTEITLEKLALLGIDGRNRLYWNGRQVEVRRRIELTPWQRLGAAITVAAAVLGGLGGAASGGTAVIEAGCQRGLWHHWCPAPANVAKPGAG